MSVMFATSFCCLRFNLFNLLHIMCQDTCACLQYEVMSQCTGIAGGGLWFTVLC